MSAVADKLDEARALIERGWTQGAYAKGKSGRVVEDDSCYAVCWCTSGALWRVSKTGGVDWMSLADALRQVVRTSFLPMWNDAPERTQAEVIDAFKRAAELARAGEQ